MSALTPREKDFLALVMRSPDRGDGWRSVSVACWQFVEGFSRDKLVEVEPDTSGGGRIRLTETGKTVVEFLI